VFDLTPAGLGWTVTTALLGTILGALVAGKPADRYGRKAVLYVIGVLYVVGALGSALTDSHLLFMIFRFLGGIGVGAASVCAPIYTAEIAPARVRGRLVGLVQFNIVLGILLAYLSNFIIKVSLPEETAWRWMFGVMAVPAVIFLVLLLTVPETPRWLMANRQQEKGHIITRRLSTDEAEARAQIDEIEASLHAAANAPDVPFFTKEHRKVILLAFFIAMFNQMSGINAILYYAPEVMKQAGAADNAAFLMSVGVGLMNLVATMAALTVIDRIGRKKLMIVGSLGYIVSLGFLSGVMFWFEPNFTTTSATLVLLGLMGFIASHAFGQGAVIWVFISEIFPNRIRGRGQSLGSLTHWVFAALTSFAFPPVIAALGGGVAFAIFAVAMVVQLFWVLKVMPETKGVPLEEMEQRLGLVHNPHDVATGPQITYH
jgi:sugar porter (SP) family MFS transporter